MPLPTRLTATTLVTFIAATVVALSISVSQEWWVRTLDARAQAARSTPQAKNTPAEADHLPVERSVKAQAATWPDAEIIAALEECVRLLNPNGDRSRSRPKPSAPGSCSAQANHVLRIGTLKLEQCSVRSQASGACCSC